PSGRPQTRYVCQSCGESFLRWEGQCRACSAWHSLVETQVRQTASTARRGSAPRAGSAGGAAAPITLADVGEPDQPRLAVGIGELARVLGGGLVPGAVGLVGG